MGAHEWLAAWPGILWRMAAMLNTCPAFFTLKDEYTNQSTTLRLLQGKKQQQKHSC